MERNMLQEGKVHEKDKTSLRKEIDKKESNLMKDRVVNEDR